MGLYVNPLNVRAIEGLDDDAGQELLEALVAHSTHPAGVYPHAWQNRDLIVFDTIGTMHSRAAFDSRRQRFLKQLSVHCPAALGG